MQNHDHDHDHGWGQIHVSRKCCGAGTCRNFAPDLLGELPLAQDRSTGGSGGDNGGDSHRGPSVLPGAHEEGAFTGVLRQPQSREELLAARTAAAACPFGAIRVEQPRPRVRPGELGSPWRAFPRHLEDNVWALGSSSTKTIGALSYFIEREGGGVLIDTPKPSEALYRWLEQHGGVRWLFLTHRDHTYHHAEFAARFPGCLRVLGAADVDARGSEYSAATGDVEVKLSDGLAPLTLEGAPLAEEALADAELAVITQPGHTPGSACLLYRGRFLFTGDHLFYSRRRGHIVGSRLQCWEDWGRQTRSVRYLAALAEAGRLRFSWILPGHGEWHRFEGDANAAATARELQRALAWMEKLPPGHVPLARYIPFSQGRTSPRSAIGRVVRAIGGEGGGSDAWLLPPGAYSSLPDYDPGKTRAAALRVVVGSAAAIGAAAGAVWLAARAARGA
jgi:glyoxylase-like metal-dependent hydrolase (beta-lactamase superfamily II)/ferredoxin